MKKKLLILLGLTFLGSLIIEGIAWLAAPEHVESIRLPDDARAIYSEDQFYTSGYDVSGDSFVPIDEDPQLGFVFPEEKVGFVVAEFLEPIKTDTTVEVYFASNNEPLGEENKKVFTIKADSMWAEFGLEELEYTQIRLDINGTFSLSEVYFCEGEPGFLLGRDSFNVGRCFARFGVFFALLSVFLLIKTDRGVNLKRCYLRAKSHPYIIFLAIAFCLVLFKVNFSNMRCYQGIIPNNIASLGATTLGQPRGVRSDEYLVGVPTFLTQCLNGDLSLLFRAGDSVWQTIYNVFILLNPYYWGRLFLPDAYAFSWTDVMNVVISCYAFFRLFDILTKNKKLSAAAAFILVFSPGAQWWSGAWSAGKICGFIVLFYDYFNGDNRLKKTLCAYGLVCLTSTVVPQLYPAWDIPRVYLFLLILICIYISERKINFHKSDIPYVTVTTVLMVLFVLSYFISQAGATEAMLDTVYPGKRFSAGGDLSINGPWAKYLLAPFLPYKELSVAGTNQSEISAYYCLFPIPFIIYLAQFKELKKRAIVNGLVVFCALCAVYMIVGIGETLARVTLWSYTTSDRLFTVFEFASNILLILECAYIAPRAVEKIKAIRKPELVWLAVIDIGILAFMLWVVNHHFEYVEYIGAVAFGYAVVALLMVGNLMFLGRGKAVLAVLVLLTLFTGAIVNPINFGVDIMEGTPLAQEIRAIDTEKTGRWIALDNMVMPKYVYAQGVDCLNYLSWPPRFDLFEPLDEDGKYTDVYNRYAHMTVNLTNDETSLYVLRMDSIEIDLNYDDMKLWGIDYVVNQGYFLEDTASVAFNLLYHDNLDNVNIYEVEYLA